MKGKTTKMVRMALIVGASALAGVSTSSHADSLAVNFDVGVTQVTDALTGFSTTGAMMDGMTVTAYFDGGGSETVI